MKCINDILSNVFNYALYTPVISLFFITINSYLLKKHDLFVYLDVLIYREKNDKQIS